MRENTQDYNRIIIIVGGDSTHTRIDRALSGVLCHNMEQDWVVVVCVYICVPFVYVVYVCMIHHTAAMCGEVTHMMSFKHDRLNTHG